MPKVAFEQLEPGSVVKTPDAIIAQGWTKEPTIVYIGTVVGTPQFLIHNQAYAWPASPNGGYDKNGFTKRLPLPEAFDVVEDKVTKEGFVKTFGTQPNRIYASGCDPEIFVVNGEGKVIPARSALPDKKKGTGQFFDGLQAEFTPGAGGCLEGLANQVQYHLAHVLTAFRNKNPHAKLSIQNTIKLTKKEMDTLADEDVVFRCSNSMNVYDDIRTAPEPREYLFRFAGGHIHVGSNEGYSVSKPAPVVRSMVRAMDAVLGVAGVSMARNLDTPERRKNYGPAGEFRLPKHGLEYRVLSNFWLCSPLIYHLTFEIARWAYRLGETGMFDCVWQGSDGETRACINNCDVKLAQEIIKRNSGIYLKLFEQRWKGYESSSGCAKNLVSKAMDTIMNGVDVVVKDPADIEGNWALTNGNWISYGDGPNQKWRRLQCK